MKLSNYNKIISANWKMNCSLSLIDEFKRFFTKNYENLNNDIAVIICPPATYLYKFNEVNTFAEGSGLNEKESDVVGRLTIKPNELLDISYKARLDVGDFKVKRTEVSASAKIKKLNTNIWYDEATFIWLKASFDKTGYWEYRLKKYN